MIHCCGGEKQVEIVKIALVHVEDGQVLSTRSKGKDAYYLPGGKPEGEESELETLVREIREELSMVLDASTCSWLGEFIAPCHGKPAGWTVRMRCYDAPLPSQPIASSEIAEVVWLSYKDRPFVSPVDQKIFDWLRGNGQLL